MQTCPDCGSPWSGTLACPECARRERERNSSQVAIDLGGASFIMPTMELANESWRCENCGKENRGDRNHCWSCSTTKGARGPSGGRTVVRRPRICSHCLSVVDADAKFCPSCATPVSSDATCPNCGNLLNPNAKFCKYCAAAAPGHRVASPAPPETSSTNAFERQREKADRLTQGGIATAIVSALLFAWGYYYTSSFTNAGRAVLMNLSGQTDSTYQLAQWCTSLGAIGFIVGLVLLIVGFAQR